VGTSYTFTVTAKNSFGSSATTSGSLTPVTVPQTPTIGSPTITAAGLSVPVTAGANGGSTITGYTVTSNPGNISVTSATAPVLVPTILPVTGGSITAGTIYSFTATANNVAGASLPTSVSSAEIDTPTFVTSGLLCNYDFYRGSYGGYNAVLYSEDFTNANWSKGQVTVSSPGTIVAPDGSTTAQKMVTVNGATGRQSILQSGTSVVGHVYELSICVKQAERRYINLWWDNQYVSEGGYLGAYQVFDLQTGTFVGASTWTTANVFSTPLGNGWYRVSVKGTAAAGSTNWYLNCSIGDANQNSFTPGIQTGDGTSGVYIWGAQVRDISAGTVAPGYIKTTSSSINYTTGTTIYDLGGNGYNTTINNFGGYSNSSSNGYGSLIFNGASTTGAATGGTMPNMGSGFTGHTISFWVNKASESKMLIAGSDGYIWGDNSWSGPNGEYYFSHSANIPVGTWGHWTFVANSNYTYNIYRDGYLESYSTGNYTGSLAGTGNLTGVVLGNGYGPGYNWQGSLGKLSFYNRALSASEALQNFNADRVRYGV
jgi:hypothetical protein